MSRFKMVLMLALLLATVISTATTFYPSDGLSAHAQQCPGPNETEGTCVPNQNDWNFAECKGTSPSERGQPGDPISVCSQEACSYRGPNGDYIWGTCCTPGGCYKDNGWD